MFTDPFKVELNIRTRNKPFKCALGPGVEEPDVQGRAGEEVRGGYAAVHEAVRDRPPEYDRNTEEAGTGNIFSSF